MLRELTKSNVPWKWTVDHDNRLDELKREISSTSMLKLFDPKLEIQADASQSGFGAWLMLERGPIAYVSLKLAKTEKRYAQIEKDLLATYFAMDKFHQFVYGNKVKVYTE